MKDLFRATTSMLDVSESYEGISTLWSSPCTVPSRRIRLTESDSAHDERAVTTYDADSFPFWYPIVGAVLQLSLLISFLFSSVSSFEIVISEASEVDEELVIGVVVEVDVEVDEDGAVFGLITFDSLDHSPVLSPTNVRTWNV
jgi:hypothetical protein